MKRFSLTLRFLPLITAHFFGLYAGETVLINYQDGQYQVYQDESRELWYTDRSGSKAIQWAVDQAGEGGKVVLSRGIYLIDQPIEIKSGLRFSGQGRGTELRLSGTNQIAIKIQNVNAVQIDHLAVMPGENRTLETVGIVIDSCQGCTISHVLAVSFSKYGLQIKNSQDCLISRSYFIDNIKSNVLIENPMNENKPIRLDNCFMLWGGAGVIAKGGKGIQVHSTILQHINGVAFDIASDGFALTGTRIFWSESPEQSVRVQGKNFKIANNIFCWSRGHSIVLDGAKDGTIIHNNLIDVGPPPRDGIFKSCIVMKNGTQKVSITENALFNWDDWTQGPMAWGIVETADCQNNNITDNNIHFYKEGDIDSKGQNTVVVRNLSDPGLDDQRLLPDFDVWRERVRKFIDTSLLGNFDPNTGGHDLVIKPVNGTFRVSKAITGEMVFNENEAGKAIDLAIDYLDGLGGTITLTEGLYPIKHTIVVKANIWLRGQGETTVIQPISEMDACIRLYKASQALVSDLKVTRSDKDPEVQTGIAIRHTVTAQIVDTEVNGFDQYGIYLEGDQEEVPKGNWGPTAGPGLILVNGCRITNNKKDNIFIETSGSYIGNAIPVVISDNLIIGGGTGIHNWAICSNVVDNVIVQTGSFGMLQMANSILNTGNLYYQTGHSAISAYDATEQMMHPTYDRRDNNNNKECNITNNIILKPRGHGIEISEQWGTISGNRIADVGEGSVISRYGIWLHEDSESYTVSGNIITNNPDQAFMICGIKESGRKNLITKNRIKGYKEDAVCALGKHTLVEENTGEAGVPNDNLQSWKLDRDIKLNDSKGAIRDYILQKINQNGLD